MAKERPEQIIYRIKREVRERFFNKIGSIRRFPEDFLDEKTKKDLAIPIKYPKTLKLGPKVIKRGLQRKKTEINLKEIQEMSELFKEWEKETEFKYVEVLLPEGPPDQYKLKINRKFEICFKGTAVLKFDSYAEAKYVLYSRRKGQLLYKIPKDETAVEKAVKDYEKYLKGIRERLEKAYMKRKASREAAEYLANEAMKEKGLKGV